MESLGFLIHCTNTEVFRYYDTGGIRQKYHIVLTIRANKPCNKGRLVFGRRREAVEISSIIF